MSMLGTLGSLFVDLRANAAGFQSDMGRAARIAAKETEAIRRKAMEIGKAFGAAAVAGGVAFTALVKQALNAQDEMAKLARSTGVSTEALSELQHVASLSGVDDLGKSLNKLNKSVGDAARGVKEPADAFKALGVEIFDAEGKIRDTEAILYDVTDAFASFEDGAAKSTAAQILFGRAGAQMISFLNSGSEAFREGRKEAADFGLTVRQDAAEAAEVFNDNLSRVRAASQGVTNQVAQELAPTLSDLSTQFVEWTKNSDAVANATAFVGRMVKGTIALMIGLKSAAVAVGKTLGGVAAASARLFDGVTLADAMSPMAFIKVARNADDAFAILKDMYADARDGVSGDIEAMARVIEAGAERIDKANDKIAEGAGGGKRTLNLPSTTGGAGAGGGLDKTARSSLREALEAEQAIRDSIAALEDQARTYGMTARQIELYRLQQMGAGEADMARADAALRQVEIKEQEASLQDYLNQIYANNIEVLTGTDAATRAYQQTLAELNELLARGRITQDEYNAAVIRAQDAFEETGKQADEFSRAFVGRIQSTIGDTIYDTMTGNFKDIGKRWLELLNRMVADAAAAQIGRALFGPDGTGGGLLDGLMSAAAGFFGGGAPAGPDGARAGGGDVYPGVWYRANENGPEYFQPHVPGTLVPASKMGGSLTLNQTNNIVARDGRVSPMTLMQIKAQTAAALADANRRNN